MQGRTRDLMGGKHVFCYVVTWLWQYKFHYVMAVNYHSVCTAHHNEHNINLAYWPSLQLHNCKANL